MFFLKSEKMEFQCRYLRFSILLYLHFFFILAAVIPARRIVDQQSLGTKSTGVCSFFAATHPKNEAFVSIGCSGSIIKAHLTINSKNVVSVRVDIPDVTKLPGGKKCIMSNNDGPMGLLYHIHSNWYNREKTWGIGEYDCRELIVRGHWDPTHTCSKSSKSLVCSYLPSSSVLKNGNGRYVCDPEIYATEPFSCEVGDLSGKFGPILMRSGDPDKPNLYFGEERFHDYFLGGWCMLEYKSIVFHCQNSDKIACGKIQLH